MSQLRAWLHPPRRVMTIFLIVTLVSAGALIFLVRLLFEQDRTVEIQRRQERLEQAAERGAAVMKDALASLEHRMMEPAGNAGPIPEGILILDIRDKAIEAQPQGGLLYVPQRPQRSTSDVNDARLAEGERLEFAERNATAATMLYASLATDPKPETRAIALNRLARTQRKAGNFESALSAYDKIAELGDIRVEDLPAGLLARAGRASVFEATHQTAGLGRETAALIDDLHRGRWRLLRAEYEFYSGLARSWLETAKLGVSAPSGEDEAVVRTEAALWLWQERPWIELAIGQRVGEAAARRVIQAGGQPALVMWAVESDQVKAAAASQNYLASLCRQAFNDHALACALTDQEGRAIAGPAAPSRNTVTLTSATTGLPWGLQVFPADPNAAIISPRRGVLAWLLAVLVVLWGTSALFIMRALARELRVSRLQSDFVAAVSHEFRSPLSSIGQISEMLLTDRLNSDDLRKRSYSLLARESARLRDLVEGLLEFGRLEAGRALYQFESVEAGAFIEGLAGEFGERVAPAGYRVELTRPAAPVTVRADREALARAVTNLLDNAVKYSPDCHTVWLNLEQRDGRVAIAVRDKGLGIPASEQREVFERFVRGSNTKAMRIKGTGIGLAMARHIADAHGGEILLSSEPGQGSLFTILLPPLS